jgi:2-iminobutanoate/2-iminopropanoate deaminase
MVNTALNISAAAPIPASNTLNASLVFNPSNNVTLLPRSNAKNLLIEAINRQYVFLCLYLVIWYFNLSRKNCVESAAMFSGASIRSLPIELSLRARLRCRYSVPGKGHYHNKTGGRRQDHAGNYLRVLPAAIGWRGSQTIVAHCLNPSTELLPCRADLCANAGPMGAEPHQERGMVLKIERFQPEGMNVRMSGGKPSYSHVVRVSGSGKIVYTAGQLARDADGNCVGKGDMRAQMEQTFQNLDRCLKAAGATWADVVKTNTFVTDFDEFQKCADIRMRYLGVATPTSTTVGVTRLAGPDFMIEIEAVAVVNS